MRLLRGVICVVLVAVALSGPGGCSKGEGTGNAELKVPDVPPSSSGGGKKLPGKK
jgi:hypothetical protein